MIQKYLSTLKIHKLTQEQYERELNAGRIDSNAIYLTEDKEQDLSHLATKAELENKSDKGHNHDNLYDTKGSANAVQGNLNTHTGNSNIHVTALNKENWNKAYSHSQSAPGVSAGSYRKVTVNSSGHVTGGSNPTNLAGYGITDAYTKTQVNALVEAKANSSHTHGIVDITNLQEALNGKADSSHGTHVTFSTTTPVMDGIAGVGSASTVARSDHKHPTDTSRASNSEFQAHISNNTHITSNERTQWGTAYTHSKSAHAPSNAQANQNAFSNVKAGSTTITADTTTDTLEIAAGTGISISGDATNDKVTITNSGVRSIGTGSSNGTISVNINGSSANVAIKGLGSAAYTASNAYDAAGLAESKANAALSSAKTYTNEKIADLINGAPGTLDTLGKIAAAMRNDKDIVEVLEKAISDKVDKDGDKMLSTNDYTDTEKTKLSGIASGAEVNQNAFSNITVGSTTIKADSKTDTLTLVAGNNITLTPDATSDSVTITATNTTYGAASTSSAGLMSAADKVKLNSIAENANAYSLPTASSSTLGGVKTGSNITNSSGTISLTKANVVAALGYTPPTTNTTYVAATTDAAGLMSASDKTKLNGIAVGASAVSFSRSLTSGTKIGTITINGTATDLYCKTDTNNAVSQSRTTTDSYRALLMHNSYGAHGTDPGSTTSGVYYHESIMASPATGAIKATKFIGALEGNATSATSAAKWTTARTLTLTGSVTGSVSIDGSGNVSLATTTNHTHNYAGSSSAGGSAISANGVKRTDANANALLTYTKANKDSYGWGIVMRDANNKPCYLYFASTKDAEAPSMMVYGADGSTNSTILTTANYNTWAATKNHGYHVPTPQTANNAVFLRNDNTWQTVTPANIGAAASSHTHSYLPLSGGTLTGNVSYKTTNYTSTPIQIIDDGTNYGHTLLVGGGGTTYVGAGESASTLYTNLGVKSTENLILGADSNIVFYPGADSASSTSGVTLDVSKNFYPQTNNTGSVGTSSYKWTSMYATTFYGALSGNASTASKWATARTLTLTGSVTGSVSIDGSGNVSLATTTNHTHSYLPLSGGAMTGAIQFNGMGNNSIYNGANDAVNGVGGALNNLVISSWNGVSFTTSCASQTYTGKTAVSINCRNGNVYAAQFNGALNGNAATATKLATARTISLTGSVTGSGSFDGSGNLNITTSTNHSHNSITTQAITNWNGSTTNGFYQGNGASNAPGSSGWYWGFRMQHSGGYGAQIAIGNGTNTMHFRSQDTNGSGTWRNVLHDGNYSSYAATKDHTHSYLPLSGGTLTGDLTAPRIKLSSTSAVRHIQFSRAGLNYVTTPDSGSIVFIIGESKSMERASASFAINNTSIAPGSTKTINCGTSDYRWASVYSNIGNFSGQVTSTYVGAGAFQVTTSSGTTGFQATRSDITAAGQTTAGVNCRIGISSSGNAGIWVTSAGGLQPIIYRNPTDTSDTTRFQGRIVMANAYGTGNPPNSGTLVNGMIYFKIIS